MTMMLSGKDCIIGKIERWYIYWGEYEDEEEEKVEDVVELWKIGLVI